MPVMVVFFIAFFFFQAEDGIRDDLVTGVQTCALPISHPASAASDQGAARFVGTEIVVAHLPSFEAARCYRHDLRGSMKRSPTVVAFDQQPLPEDLHQCHLLPCIPSA